MGLMTAEERQARHERRILGGMVAGAIGGLVAGWVMNKAMEKMAAADARQGGQKPNAQGGEEPATVRTARRVSARMGRELSDEEAQNAGPLVHYLFSTMMGALYGGLVELMPFLSAGLGSLYGTALWIGADEVAVPALGLSKQPLAYPPNVHGRAWLAHVVWGATTDLVRRVIRLGS